MRTRVIFAFGSAASARGDRTKTAAGATASDFRNDLLFINIVFLAGFSNWSGSCQHIRFRLASENV